MRESGTKAAEVMMTGGAKEVEESPAENRSFATWARIRFNRANKVLDRVQRYYVFLELPLANIGRQFVSYYIVRRNAVRASP